MLVTCPHCGFSREVDEARLPNRSAKATCPSCRQRFTFPPATEGETADEEGRDEPRGVPVPHAPTAAATAFLAAAARPKAGFWIRTLAALIDILAIGLLESVLGSLLVSIGGIEPGLFSPEARLLATVLTAFSMALGYAYRVFFIGYCGQTPGKMALRIKVILTDGKEMTYPRALLREVVGKFLSKIVFGIGYLMVAFDRQKQGLHDKIADTYVVKL